MTEKSNTNVYWYILLFFLIIIFVAGMQQYSAAMLSNPDVNMSDEDLEYHFKLVGIELDEFNATATEIQENPVYGESNETGAQAKDFALEFFYSRSVASQIWQVASDVFSIPGYIIKLLNIPDNSISWLVGILNWFWRIMLVLAGYYLIRGLK